MRLGCYKCEAHWYPLHCIANTEIETSVSSHLRPPIVGARTGSNHPCSSPFLHAHHAKETLQLLDHCDASAPNPLDQAISITSSF